MSKVLYREYRPRTLDDVKGQDHIVNALKNALKNKSIAHAYLFTGSHGVGKTSVARILAHLINNLEYTGEDEHLDIIEIDAASNRRIDEIRELREKAFVAPTSAKYKVYIIDEVHMLTREAFNALLKTLEEPPEHAIFILATTEAHKVPKTIISRTQRFSFKPQEQDSLESRLSYIAKKENIPITDEALRLIARHSNQSFRDGISLLDQLRHVASKDSKRNINEEDVALLLGVPSSELLDSLLSSLLHSDSALLFKTTEELRQQAVSATVVSQELLRNCREYLTQKNEFTQEVIGTMKSLLENINNATYDTIEVAILQHMSSTSLEQESRSIKNSAQKTQEASQNEVDKPKKNNEDSVVNGTKSKATKSDDVATSKNTSQKISWNDVLESIKGHHNTLYGILKMSDVDMNESTLYLKFRFAFHQKQFLQAKHVKTLKNALKELTSKDFDVKTEVSAQKQNIKHDSQDEPKQKIVKDDYLSSLSNIFSGAELLE